MPGSTVTIMPGRSSSSPPFLLHARQLVNLAADAVAQAVAEFLAEPGLLDHVAGDAVGLHGGDAGAEELDRRLLRLQHDLVNLLDLRR